MIASALILPLMLIMVESKKLSLNVNYNGPFNPHIHQSPRRLVAESSVFENVQFFHGVASGDATDTDVLIWTRVTPPYQDEWALDREDMYNQTELDRLKSEYESISIEYAISTSKDSINFDCSNNQCGLVQTSVDIDYTIKVIIDGLTPNTWYYYQFRVNDATSDIGRTRTIPSADTEIDSWRFAFSSCKQVAHGFFNNLADIAARDDLDMMVWLGDYVYEFPNTDVVDGAPIGRFPFPDDYLYNLSSYRGRYLQHHLQEELQAAHQQLPWYIVWDDHEVVNDYWKEGGPSRWQKDLYGVDFESRRANGYQAFFEWTPTRTLDVDARGGLYRSYQFGDLFDLIMIDSRSQRTEPAENTTYGEELSVAEHYAFGEQQRDWLLNELTTSKTRGANWRILASNDVWGQSPPVSVFNGEELFGEDKLEGYDGERQVILDYIMDQDINNIVNMAGGPHIGIAQKVFSTGEPIKDDPNSYPIMTEFTVDALCAPKLFEDTRFLPYMNNYTEDWSWVSPYFRLLMDGYSVMTVGKSKVMVEYWINNNTKVNTTRSELDTTICVMDGEVEFVMDCTDTTTMAPNDTLNDDEKEGVEAGIIVVIVLAVLLVIALIVGLIWYTKCRDDGNKSQKVATDDKDEDGRTGTTEMEDVGMIGSDESAANVVTTPNSP